MNQCDGCQRGLPLVDTKFGGALHRGNGYDIIGCTAERYTESEQMFPMKYRLTKVSGEGFELTTDKLEPILNLLLIVYFCDTCIEYELPEDFDDMTDDDKLEELLMTSCGAEFIFEDVGE